nr:hypothetical protein Iba_chr07bCG8120 [Ipomoea batatas]
MANIATCSYQLQQNDCFSDGNNSFWDAVYLSPLRDSEPLLSRDLLPGGNNVSTQPQCTETIGVLATNPVDVFDNVDLIVEEDNTAAKIDLPNLNLNIFIRRKRTKKLIVTLIH